MLIGRIGLMGLAAAAEAAGVSLRTGRKWLRRFEQEGLIGLGDRSSRPSRTRATVDEALQHSMDAGGCLLKPAMQGADPVVASVAELLANHAVAIDRGSRQPPHFQRRLLAGQYSRAVFAYKARC